MSRSPTYGSWRAMVARCTNPKAVGFSRYGALGVSVCERWRDFRAFMADMGERPAGMTLDRIDNAKGYEPGNCRWATRIVQARNRPRINRVLSFQGEELTLAEWAERTGLTSGSIWNRIERLGWSIERALAEPLHANWKTHREARHA